VSGVVQTVTGPLKVPPTGHVLMHEHIVIGFPGSEHDPHAEPDWETEAARVTALLARVRERHGVVALLDAGPAELGRDVSFLARVSAASGVAIIASTGFYREGQGLGFYFHLVDDDRLDAFLRSELDRVVPALDDAHRRRVEELFGRAVELELAFFDAAYA